VNIQLLRTLIALQSVPVPDPQPESLEPRPPWEGDRVRLPEPAVVEISEGAARRLRELVEAPEPPVVMATTAEEAAQAADVLSRQMDEPFTFSAPVKGKVLQQATGPNRAQRRARR